MCLLTAGHSGLFLPLTKLGRIVTGYGFVDWLMTGETDSLMQFSKCRAKMEISVQVIYWGCSWQWSENKAGKLKGERGPTED